jgi:hypothetical protein
MFNSLCPLLSVWNTFVGYGQDVAEQTKAAIKLREIPRRLSYESDENWMSDVIEAHDLELSEDMLYCNKLNEECERIFNKTSVPPAANSMELAAAMNELIEVIGYGTEEIDKMIEKLHRTSTYKNISPLELLNTMRQQAEKGILNFERWMTQAGNDPDAKENTPAASSVCDSTHASLFSRLA